MKFVLFCNLPYAFGILKPLEDELIGMGEKPIWFVPDSILSQFPYKNSSVISQMDELLSQKIDAYFVPGNEIPYFLHGLKVQVFHGLAGEKKGHFRIRGYFDLYLTQGPYFTDRFLQLARKHKNFDVIETGWCKLDPLFTPSESTLHQKQYWLEQYGVKKILLYAPTFSPSLTSGELLSTTITNLANRDDVLVVIKFHDKMALEIKQIYENISAKNLLISDQNDIIPLLQIADIMISDTSSVVYEFILLNKPVITLNSHSENINWANVDAADMVENEIGNLINGIDLFASERQKTIDAYHPYSDGKSAMRMLRTCIDYLHQYGTPKTRKISFFNRLKTHIKYGYWGNLLK